MPEQVETQGGAIEAPLPALDGGFEGEDLSWITTTAIDNDDPAESEDAPLPDPSVEAAPAAAPAVEAKPAETVEDPKAAVEEPKVEPAPEPVKAAGEEELSDQDRRMIEALPEAERPAAQARMKRTTFMDHYLSEQPATEIRDHLKERSPERYAELESAVWEERLNKPDTFCADLFQRNPELYQALAAEVHRGDPAFFTKQITGRADVEPDYVKTALDFYERNKDSIEDEGSVSLSELDEAKLAEIERYFPDELPAIKHALELAAKAKAEEPDKPEAKTDEQPKGLTREAVLEAAAKEDELYDVARDVVGEFVVTKAMNPTTGIGIVVTDQERKSAPLLAGAKDIKGSIFLNGLKTPDGKTVLPSFDEGYTKWAADRTDVPILKVKKFVDAGEEKNVREVSTELLPSADAYYQERLKNPIFQLLDNIIRTVAQTSTKTPIFDPIVTGALPAQGNGKRSVGGAHSDDYLIQDAVNRVK